MAFRLFGPRREAAAREKKASAAGAMSAIHGVAAPAWTPRDPVALSRAGYAGNAVVFRCVRLIAEAAAAAPLRLTEGGAEVETHPARDLLARPNPGQDGAAFLETLYGNLQLFGNAYIEAAAGADGAPSELYALRPDRMRVIPGRDGWPAAYEYRVGARTHRFDMSACPAPILHLRAYHPLDDHYGMAPITPAATAVDVHNAATRWTKALLDNAARPSGAVIYRGADGAGQLTEEQYDRLVAELESRHQGAANAGRPMLLEGGLDWKPMGLTPSDMEFLETKHAAAREIALAFGVPPMLLGLPGDATYANYAEANRAFFRQTVAPLTQRMAAALTDWIGGRWGGALRIAPDLDAVPALAAERDARWRRIAEADFLDEDEKRRLLGLPARPQPDRA